MSAAATRLPLAVSPSALVVPFSLIGLVKHDVWIILKPNPAA